ncbi:helix-turn-helix domain-containing protein [Ammoniphilus resinae]|uniref:Transcriptional regulator with XRE-family HTH domain n=1 Tax=Ammoniphilus resinae TaxID=861532 RepID=A0ABS4GXM7_9BACL|nr:helix-turn-helix domain-containing protein [Ammoniphilus resinae]MBP1935033.1 transcriptional regulator with XRE-family HTH domain [Ammoniphilus resinae]
MSVSLEFICNLYEKTYTEVGEAIGRSPQELSNWAKQRRPIPKESLASLCDYFKVDERSIVDNKRYCKSLSKVEELNLQIDFWVKKSEDEAEEYTDLVYDPEDDKEYEVERIYFPHQEIIMELRKQKRKQMLLYKIDLLIHRYDETEGEPKLLNDIKGDFNTELFERVETVLREGSEKEIKALNTLLYILTEYGFGKPNPFEHLEGELFNDFLIALKKQGI